MNGLRFSHEVAAAYEDVLTPNVMAALHALAPFDRERQQVMTTRLARRAARAKERRRIGFLDPNHHLAGTSLTARDAREGRFVGSAIPHDLKRQWIQGTGPAARVGAKPETSLRNVAYALLSGADGWMFDGEDALGQLSTMALDNQRSLKLAFHQDPLFLRVVEQVAREMNAWAGGFFGRPIVDNWQQQLTFTTRIFRPRGLHLDDRHVHFDDGHGFSASIVDTVLYIVNNHSQLNAERRSLVLYIPKIQTAEEAALWHAMLTALEEHLYLPADSIKVYVLIDQLESCFQLM